MGDNPSSSRMDRKTIEKNRRNPMKALYSNSNLNALVPHQNSKELATTLLGQLDQTTKYIKKLQMQLEKLREKRASLMGTGKPVRMITRGPTKDLKPPKIEIRAMGSTLEVQLITDLQRRFMFTETIRILHEEGADIVNSIMAVVEDAVFHTAHSTIGGSVEEAARISRRLKNFVYKTSDES